MKSELIKQRRPTPEERKRGAEVVFVRKVYGGETFTILGARCYESWEQWGAPREILSDNCDTIQQWRERREGK